MKNGNKPAYPVRGADNTPFTNGDDFEEYAKQCDPTIGLTKREMFAMAAMQGILANATTIERGISAVLKGNAKGLASHVAGMAVEYADELLNQLSHE